MKTIKTILILCVVLCFASSCKKDVNMTLVQKTVLENTDIRQIEVSDAWQVTIIADNSTCVELEYSAYLENNVKTSMEGTNLKIGFSGNVYPAIGSVFRAIVHTPQLEKVEADEAAKVQCNGEFAGQHLVVKLNDASQCNGLVFSGQSCEINMNNSSLMTGFQFVGDTCYAELDNASQFNGQIHATVQFDIELDSASLFVNKDGTTANASIKLHDASILNMVETQVDEMHVELSGASEATVWVTALIEGTLTDASTLYYKGHPQKEVDCSVDSSIIHI